MNTIFIQIAAYRDPEFLPTIIDCLVKARRPDALTFGICWQKSEKDRSITPLRSPLAPEPGIVLGALAVSGALRWRRFHPAIGSILGRERISILEKNPLISASDRVLGRTM